VNEQLTLLAIDHVQLDFAGVMRDIEEKMQVAAREEVCKDPACVVAKDLAIGERAIDRGPHRAQVALANLRIDRGAGKLAIRQHDAGGVRAQYHFLEKLGPDLVTKPARAAMSGHHDLVLCKAEALGDNRIINLGNGLDFKWLPEPSVPISRRWRSLARSDT
jgi:hypothetical protein